MAGKKGLVGLGEQDELSARSVMVTQAPSKLKYATPAGRDQPEIWRPITCEERTIHQQHPRQDQQQPHNSAPIKCLLINKVSELGDEKNPQSGPRGADHRDRQRFQGKGQSVERGCVVTYQAQRETRRMKFWLTGNSMVPNTSKAAAISRKMYCTILTFPLP